MTATNHALTGAVIALAVKQPAIAFPLAVASHFLLDSLPHFGGIEAKSRKFLYILAADAGVASALLITIGMLTPAGWLLPVGGAICAMAPDLMWMPNFIREISGQKTKEPDFITKWHKRIQRYERPWGMAIELVWFVMLLPVLFTLMFSM